MLVFDVVVFLLLLQTDFDFSETIFILQRGGVKKEKGWWGGEETEADIKGGKKRKKQI